MEVDIPLDNNRASVAGMDPNMEDHDLLFAVVLPNLAERIDDDEEKKREYTLDQARSVDFASLPLRFNHNDDLPPVGRTIAYRVNDKTGAAPRAEVLFKLNREPDKISDPDDELGQLTMLQRNLLMEGVHRGVSLGHYFSTEFVNDCGKYNASAAGRPGRTIRKEAYEISTCKRGKRAGSDIYEYMPCRRSLLRSTDRAVRSFAKLYGYTQPESDVTRDSPAWRPYIDTLHNEVKQRRLNVIENNGYAQMLRARGFHAASDDVPAAVTDPVLRQAPWFFVPHMANRGMPGADRFDMFAGIAAQDNFANR